MLKNYLKIATRNLLRSKGFSFINIAGLGVGMTLALLISIWIIDELNYDRFHQNYEQLHQLMLSDQFDGKMQTWRSVPLPLAEELRQSFPEVKRVTETDWGGKHGLKVGEQRLFKSGLSAQNDFLKMFSFPLVVGNIETALLSPDAIVIDQTLGESLFGHQNYNDMLHQTIRLDNEHDMKVSAVMENIPDNSSFQFNFLTPFSLWEKREAWVASSRNNWDNNSFQIYLELQTGVDEEVFAEKVKGLIKVHSETTTNDISLHACRDWRLRSEFENGKAAGGFIKYVRLFGIIGLFVLLIACINFMNLSTARSSKRSKEVGIRKTLGSQRSQLIYQFLGEAILIALLAFALSIVVAEMAIPFFNDLTEKSLSIPVDNPYFWLLGLGFTLISGLLAGSYPAFFLSTFRPISLMKHHSVASHKGSMPRKVLVVSQFAISTALIIATLVVYQQIQHVKDRNVGYNPDRLISINLSSDLINNFKPLKNELLASGMISKVSKASSPITSIYSFTKGISWPGKPADENTLFATVATSADYFQTLEIELKEGRFFSEEFPSDQFALVLNQSALDKMNLDQPFETTIPWSDTTFRVVGIVNDVIMSSPFTQPPPTVFTFNPAWNGTMILRLDESVNSKEALTQIAPIFKRHNPTYPFEYNFVNETYNRKFASEELIGKLAALFGGLAIFISCLGLFGLAAFMAERRSKEISIRKILGASVLNLWTLLSKDFIGLVLLATLIAIPITTYFLNGWLEGYDYRITLNWSVFALAGILAIFATLITVSFQSIKVALSNPVESLRSE